jgi:hypothetical protein
MENPDSKGVKGFIISTSLLCSIFIPNSEHETFKFVRLCDLMSL